MKAAVEETLRWAGPVGTSTRQTTARDRARRGRAPRGRADRRGALVARTATRAGSPTPTGSTSTARRARTSRSRPGPTSASARGSDGTSRASRSRPLLDRLPGPATRSRAPAHAVGLGVPRAGLDVGACGTRRRAGQLVAATTATTSTSMTASGTTSAVICTAGAGRRLRRQIVGADFAHRVQIVERRHERLDLHDVCERRPVRLQDPREVLEHLLGLRPHVTRADEVPLEVERELPGHVDPGDIRGLDPHGVRVGPHRGRDGGRVHPGHAHEARIAIDGRGARTSDKERRPRLENVRDFTSGVTRSGSPGPAGAAIRSTTLAANGPAIARSSTYVAARGPDPARPPRRRRSPRSRSRILLGRPGLRPRASVRGAPIRPALRRTTPLRIWSLPPRRPGSWQEPARTGSSPGRPGIRRTRRTRPRTPPAAARGALGRDRPRDRRTTIPARNAPTAAETFNASVPPAVSSTIPRMPSSNASSESAEHRAADRGTPSAGDDSTPTTTSTATATDSPTVAAPPPTSRTVASGRNPAMTRSSITRMASTRGVSRLPIQPRSSSVRATTPEDEM